MQNGLPAIGAGPLTKATSVVINAGPIRARLGVARVWRPQLPQLRADA